MFNWLRRIRSSSKPARVSDLLALRPRVEGVSITGGEPFQQPEALLNLMERLDGSGLSRVVFSGYRLEEVRRLPLGPRILSHVDVLVAGRYVASLRLARGLIGSANQRVHFLTARHGWDDFGTVPRREVIVHAAGTIALSGIDPWRPDCDSTAAHSPAPRQVGGLHGRREGTEGGGGGDRQAD